MRKMIAFDCASQRLAATLDAAEGTSGLLIVSGGNEIRVGAHRGMALLAQRLAASGTPVFRYDRRGIGDSTGDNTGYEGARDDLIAAAAAFRAAAPHVAHLIGFGNCDAATTLALWGRDAGIDAVVLANPWTVAPDGDMPAPAAIRAHYAARMRDPRALLRAAAGGVSFRRLAKGLHALTHTAPQQSLTGQAIDAIAHWGAAATIVLATRDNTAITYADAAARAGITPRTIAIDTASHSFARPADTAALEAAIRDVLSARG